MKRILRSVAAFLILPALSAKAADDPVDLQLCLYKQGSGGIAFAGKIEDMRRFVTRKPEVAPFKSIEIIEHMGDSKLCDATLKFVGTVFPKHVLVASQTGKILKTFGSRDGARVKLRRKVHAFFKKKPELARELTAARKAASEPGSGSITTADLRKALGEIVAKGDPSQITKKTYASDVDKPAYKNPPRPQDFALVVGIEKYSEVPRAKHGARDADAAAKHLEALGVPPRNLILLKGDKATRTGLAKYLKSWLPKNTTPDSRVYFYFSGHGAPDPETGRAYLLPFDGDPNFLEDTAFPLNSLYASLAKLKAKEVVVALDACFSGAGGRSVLPEGARPLVTKIEEPTNPANISVFAAAQDTQITTTLEDEGHGIFTYYLLKGLNGAAKGEKGKITNESLYDYLKPNVQDEARRQNRDQTPTFRGSSSLRFR